MSTYKEVLEIKTLWRGKPETVAVSIPMKQIEVGWNKKREEPLKVLDFNPEKDGLMLYVYGKPYASIIIITGSITFQRVYHIQKLRNMIQLFAGEEKE